MKSECRQSKVLEKWAKRIREWRLSGKKANEWCREQQVGYTQFIVWRKRFEKMSSEEASSIFMELSNERAPDTIKIDFFDFTVTVPERFDPHTLLNCLRVLKSL